MKQTKLTALAVALAASLVTISSAQAQDNNNNNNNRREEFRQRMMDSLKTALKATDDEWAVIQPLIEKVTTKQREVMQARGGFGGFGGGGPGGRRGGGENGGGAGGGGGAQANNAGGGNGGQRGGGGGGSPESQSLREALDSDSTSADDIKSKLAALRDSRKKANGELESAREDLKKVLTTRQEAVLVSRGLLE